MPLHPDFPTDPLAVLDPAVRWYPGDALLGDLGREKLIPPLVEKVRRGVAAWRASGYAGASETTRALLSWWFGREHFLPSADGWEPFAWRFAQREAVESAIWLYEIERARDPYSLIRFDSSGAISQGMFDEDWTRYVLKLATGAGKTKVMSLLIAWSYFHKLYEEGSTLSTNILLIAPNIIVLDRLALDFEAGRIFNSDPLIPENGYEGRFWKADFRLTVHIQDQLGHVGESGNLFLTNIHRVREGAAAPSADDENLTDFFLGKKPAGKTTDSTIDLGDIVRTVPDLLVINDEAHHVRKGTDWFAQVEDLHRALQRKGGALSAQFDLTATPRHNNKAIFVQTISDYPLVEAIAQGVVKTPVVPDPASRARLRVQQSDVFSERYADHLELGVIEWRRTYEELRKADKKSVLFVMTDNTTNCDEVGEYLEARYPELKGAVLVIHTNASGVISETARTAKSKAELDVLRKQSREIDSWESPFKAVVSVMVLREGWDVRNVTTIVGLRPYGAPSGILPEQTLGRGLRPMFAPGSVEKVSVVGTDAFLDFVEEIRNEGVELQRVAMGPTSPGQGPMVIEVERGNPDKDIDGLDIALPKLKARIERGYDLSELDAEPLPPARLPFRSFSEAEQRQIVFRNINTGEESHTTELDASGPGDWRNVVGWFTRQVMADLRLVGGFDVLFGKVKAYVEDGLFDRHVDLDGSNVLRNLSDAGATKRLFDTLKSAINRLTVRDHGSTHVQEHVKVSGTRPAVVRNQPFVESQKSVFNKVVGNGFERPFAQFLERAGDVQAYFRNTEATGFRIEYQSVGGAIRNYIPDFVVRDSDGVIWIVETKGREDVEDARKWNRLALWCADATGQDPPRQYRSLTVREADWDNLVNPLGSFAEALSVFG